MVNFLIFLGIVYDRCLKIFPKRCPVDSAICKFSLSFFGMLALEKYTRKDVMKVNTVKNIDGIPIPAITIDMYDESLMFLSQPFVSSAMLWLLPWNNIIKIQNK